VAAGGASADAMVWGALPGRRRTRWRPARSRRLRPLSNRPFGMIAAMRVMLAISPRIGRREQDARMMGGAPKTMRVQLRTVSTE
jgi:hypothetical protein